MLALGIRPAHCAAHNTIIRHLVARSLPPTRPARTLTPPPSARRPSALAAWPLPLPAALLAQTAAGVAADGVAQRSTRTAAAANDAHPLLVSPSACSCSWLRRLRASRA